MKSPFSPLQSIINLIFGTLCPLSSHILEFYYIRYEFKIFFLRFLLKVRNFEDYLLFSSLLISFVPENFFFSFSFSCSLLFSCFLLLLHLFYSYSSKEKIASQDICRDMTREDSMGRRVHLYKRFVSWVNSVLRQFLPYDPSFSSDFILLFSCKISVIGWVLYWISASFSNIIPASSG